MSEPAGETTDLTIDVILPCLNEEAALPWVLSRLPDGYRAITVLGHADDGEWWALGLNRPDRTLLRGVPTSTSSYTGTAQELRLAEADLLVTMLAELLDVDTAGDAERVAALAPDNRFARTFRRIRQLATARSATKACATRKIRLCLLTPLRRLLEP